MKQEKQINWGLIWKLLNVKMLWFAAIIMLVWVMKQFKKTLSVLLSREAWSHNCSFNSQKKIEMSDIHT